MIKGERMNSRFHSENRRRVAEHMTDKEAMLFFSGESVRKTADEDFPFFTNRNFLYLTGIKQEQSALLLQKKDDLTGECLFVTRPDVEQEVWTGKRFTDEEIHVISGAEGVEDINNLSRTLDRLLSSQQVMPSGFVLTRLRRNVRLILSANSRNTSKIDIHRS